MTQEDFSDPQVLAAERGDLDGPQAGDRITVDYEDYANLVNERDALKDWVARWIPEWPRDEMPPIGVPVRVVWSERASPTPNGPSGPASIGPTPAAPGTTNAARNTGSTSRPFPNLPPSSTCPKD